MAGELAPLLDGTRVVADAPTRDVIFPLATRQQNQRVFRLDTGITQRWSGSAWVDESAQVFIPQRFGAVGDGLTDDTTGLLAMRTALRALPSGSMPTVVMRGTFIFTDNKWLKGVTRVRIDAHGATFRNTAANSKAYGVDAYALSNNPDYWSGQGDGDFTPATNSGGYLINTTAVADQTVTCTTASDASHFAVGNVVLVHGYDQQVTASYAPNVRSWDIRTVTSANASTGVIGLDRKLATIYRSDWYEGATTYNITVGKARVLNLSRSDFTFGERLVIEGGEFLTEPTWVNGLSGALAPVGTRTVELYSVKAAAFAPSSCEKVLCIGCDFGFVEVDKVLGTVVFDACTIDSMTEGTGADRIIFTNGTKVKTQFQARPRFLTVEDCEISSFDGVNTIATVQSSQPVHSAIFRRNRFLKANTSVTAAINEGSVNTFTINSVPSGGKILLLDDATGQAVVKGVDVGTSIVSNDAAMKTGLVTAVYRDAATSKIAIDATFSALPIAAEVWMFHTTTTLIVGGNERVGQPTLPLLLSRGRVWNLTDEDTLRDGRRSMAITKNIVTAGGYDTEYLRGYVTRILVNVQRAYTGADAACVLSVDSAAPPGPAKSFGTVNLKTAGLRIFDTFTTGGAVAGDTLNTTAGVLCWLLQLRVSNNVNSVPMTGTADQLPMVTVVVDVVPQS